MNDCPCLPAASVDIEIPFHDVDLLEVAWHGHYLKYFEIARGRLLRQIGYDYPAMRDSGYAWPVTECYLKYVRPARYGQTVRVEARIVEFENRLKMEYRICDAATGEKLTRGWTIQLALEIASMELQFVTPPVLWEKLGRRP
ncbi:acyl-CoA thioesterase [Paludibacterium yongneupense]|uniref:acyl-CoA thioesterase n=1 Tax=Paludibacterium yongneupense TaxID=400061 RepID=UPI000428E6A7|nr:acyl-CoA thioesterase [Paludibacterium yongneupense]